MALGTMLGLGDLAFGRDDRPFDAGAAAQTAGAAAILPQPVMQDAQRVGRLDRLRRHIHAVGHIGVDRLDAVEGDASATAAADQIAQAKPLARPQAHAGKVILRYAAGRRRWSPAPAPAPARRRRVGGALQGVRADRDRRTRPGIEQRSLRHAHGDWAVAAVIVREARIGHAAQREIG